MPNKNYDELLTEGLVVLKHEVGLRDLLEVRNFGCKYRFIADTKVKGK